MISPILTKKEFGEVLSCYRFGLMLQVHLQSLQVHRPVAAESPSRCRFELIVAGSFLDSATSTWGSRIGCDVVGSICCKLPRCYRFSLLQILLWVKVNQRGSSSKLPWSLRFGCARDKWLVDDVDSLLRIRDNETSYLLYSVHSYEIVHFVLILLFPE